MEMLLKLIIGIPELISIKHLVSFEILNISYLKIQQTEVTVVEFNLSWKVIVIVLGSETLDNEEEERLLVEHLQSDDDYW